MSQPSDRSSNPSNLNLYPQLYEYRSPASSNASGIFNPPSQNLNNPMPISYNEPLVYHAQPIYPGQNLPQLPPINPILQNQIPVRPPQVAQNGPQHPYSKFISSSCCACFLISLIIVQILLAIISVYTYWYKYCYWDFTMTHRYANENHLPDEDGSISKLYDNNCDGKRNLYFMCPDLCSSLKHVRKQGGVFSGLVFTACSFSACSVLITLMKFRFNNNTKINWVLYFNGVVSLALYSIAFFYYLNQSKFSQNFDDVMKIRPNPQNIGNPDDFEWLSGYYLAVIVICLHGVTLLLSKCFTYTVKILRNGS